MLDLVLQCFLLYFLIKVFCILTFLFRLLLLVWTIVHNLLFFNPLTTQLRQNCLKKVISVAYNLGRVNDIMNAFKICFLYLLYHLVEQALKEHFWVISSSLSLKGFIFMFSPFRTQWVGVIIHPVLIWLSRNKALQWSRYLKAEIIIS